MSHQAYRNLILLFSLLLFVSVHADTKYHRLIWDSNPSQQATIAFSPDGASQSPYVRFGYSTDQNSWQVASVDSTESFGSLTSHFVRLTNLNSNSSVYYQVCDNNGCGQRFWFRTAPIDNSPFVVVAGGDTRTGWTTRRKGNALIAKIRPLFIMHGGDFTNANNTSEMSEFLSDWSLTFSNDVINGESYSRIYPLVPTHGNHEDNNYRTLCQVFGVDYNQDGQCDPNDTFGAFNISPLLRVYTLNSQFKNSGWSSYATAMNNWLANDLSANGDSAEWRFSQYHKPMFPHYSGKSENQILFDWWADVFYEHAMNLVVESDTHINKMTQSILPNGNNFVTTTQGGTVYVGEGSWGAPARSANDPKPWTIDLASIQQFKVIQVTESQLNVRTAQFDETATSLSKEQRDADSIVLPDNVNWWIANTVGENLALIKNAQSRSVIKTEDSSGQLITIAAMDDAFISETQSSSNFDASNEGLLADGSDSTYGKMDALIKFDLSEIPSCTVIAKAYVTINVFNSSSGSYYLHQGNNSWSEESVTWSSVSGQGHLGNLVGTFSPSSTGSQTINLNAAGISLIESWLNGANNDGFVITANTTTDGIDFDSKETGESPTLTIEYATDDNCNTPPPTNQLTNGDVVENLTAAQGEALLFEFMVPETATSLSFTMSGGAGDADLYIKFGTAPSSSDYDCRPYKNGNNEECNVSNIQSGRYYIMVQGYSDFSGVSLVANFTEDSNNSGGSFSQQNLTAEQGQWNHFSINIPAGMNTLTVSIDNGSGDADLYIRQGAQPTSSSYTCRPYKWGNAEVCTENTPTQGQWYVSIYAYEAYSGVDLLAEWLP